MCVCVCVYVYVYVFVCVCVCVYVLSAFLCMSQIKIQYDALLYHALTSNVLFRRGSRAPEVGAKSKRIVEMLLEVTMHIY
jgi:hypothetical protein